MAKMNLGVREILEKRKVIALATATENGIPNVVPVGAIKLLDDETILISDQYFRKTLRNMKNNPQAAIAVWDKSEGYQIKGTVAIEFSGPRFEATKKWIKEIGKRLNMSLISKGAVILKITEIYDISPGPDAGIRIA